jgi:putative membrane protein
MPESMPMTRLSRAVPALVLALVTTGCSVLTPATETGASPAASPAPRAPSSRASASAAATPGLTDANIAAIVVAANNADIAYADQALAKSRDADVRRFATMVKKDHETMNTVAGQLVTRLKVVPADNEASFDIRDDAEEKRESFRELEDFAFDSAYAHNEVAYHRTVLKAIDEALIPSARNAELKALLIQVRPAIAAHADHAEALAAKKVRRPR